jgi:DNA-binding transcriptional MerR regulator
MITDELLDIADVGRRSGLAPSALRFYERRGLITPFGRNGQRRTYTPDVLDRLALVACAREAGFTIAEISRFLLATPTDDVLREHLARKAEELTQNINRLQRMRNSLAHAATCSHTPLVECPDFKSRIADETA